MENKYRHEYKYLVSDTEIAIIESQINKILKKDNHVNVKGFYSIKSLYFDDYYDNNLLDNIDGTNNRKKFRIRIYNNDYNMIYLELKIKTNGKTLKYKEQITKEQCEQIINGDYLKDIGNQGELLKRLTEEMMSDRLMPKVIVIYDRVPYVSKNGNVRVTFDKNISSSYDIKLFLSNNIPKRPIMMRNINLLEVKWDDFLQDEIYSTLSISGLQQTAYSKYSLCRIFGNKGVI